MQEDEKRLAARESVGYIRSGNIVGLGSGSTASHAIRCVADELEKGRLQNLQFVATSNASAELARTLGLDLLDINKCVQIDITIDGADEFDPYLNLIKGGGGALLREKVVASLSKVLVIVTDSAKQVDTLGDFKLPVEVMQFCHEALLGRFKELGLRPALRYGQGRPYVTDNGNYIIDLDLKKISNPQAMNDELLRIPGVIENGLFIDMADIVIMGKSKETITFRR